MRYVTQTTNVFRWTQMPADNLSAPEKFCHNLAQKVIGKQGRKLFFGCLYKTEFIYLFHLSILEKALDEEKLRFKNFASHTNWKIIFNIFWIIVGSVVGTKVQRLWTYDCSFKKKQGALVHIRF